MLIIRLLVLSAHRVGGPRGPGLAPDTNNDNDENDNTNND